MANCKLCGQETVWKRSKNGKWLPPLNASDGEVHFAQCPKEGMVVKREKFIEHTVTTFETGVDHGRQLEARPAIAGPPWEPEAYCV